MVFLKETQGKLKLIRVEHIAGPVSLLSNLLNQVENRGKKVRKGKMFGIIRNPSKGLVGAQWWCSASTRPWGASLAPKETGTQTDLPRISS